MLISQLNYHEAVENYLGWCTSCQDFTRESTEPDAEDYDCPVCENNSVTGAENALIMELFELSDEED